MIPFFLRGIYFAKYYGGGGGVGCLGGMAAWEKIKTEVLAKKMKKEGKKGEKRLKNASLRV